MPVGEGWGRCQVWLTAYLAAEAEAQGQEAEEVLAPSDHAGEAPAQSSHTDPQGGCLGESRGRRTGCSRRGVRKGLGGAGEDKSLAPGVSRILSATGAARVSCPL